jgi:hypothetical protein
MPYGYLKCEFDFRTDDWSQIETKKVNFSYRGENHKVELDNNNQCYVPKEVIYTPSFSLSVFGGDMITNTIKLPVDGEYIPVNDNIEKYIDEAIANALNPPEDITKLLGGGKIIQGGEANG